MQDTIIWQRIEGALVCFAGIALYFTVPVDLAWWLAILVFFAPDLSFAGYLLGARVGATLYNAVHIYALGAVLMAIGTLTQSPLVFALGALWLAHSGFDRMLGYGLKRISGFDDTHLGRIGRPK